MAGFVRICILYMGVIIQSFRVLYINIIYCGYMEDIWYNNLPVHIYMTQVGYNNASYIIIYHIFPIYQRTLVQRHWFWDWTHQIWRTVGPSRRIDVFSTGPRLMLRAVPGWVRFRRFCFDCQCLQRKVVLLSVITNLRYPFCSSWVVYNPPFLRNILIVWIFTKKSTIKHGDVSDNHGVEHD